MTSGILSSEALILLASRPETVEVAVGRLRPDVLGVIVSQEILEVVVLKCSELEGRARFRYRVVDSQLDVGDAFERFEHVLPELKGVGYEREEFLLGGTPPMRLGVAEDDEVLRDLPQKRNRSILAHGPDPMGEKPAKRFLGYLDAPVEAPEARDGAGHVASRGL